MTISPDLFNLSGRIALITGGSRGIGSAVVDFLAAAGAHVAINYHRDEAAAETVATRARQNGVEALCIKADISKPTEAERLIQQTVERFKRLDLLICNAGIWEGVPIEKMPVEMWERTMDINLKGTWAVCKAAVPLMKKQRAGKIVIVSSTAGQRGEAGYSNYAASKGAQIALVKSLAVELGPWGINVNAVAPGWVDTDMTRAALEDENRRREISAGIPIGAIATPRDIAGPIVFLCSDLAKHVTGEVLNVNGGSVLCG